MSGSNCCFLTCIQVFQEACNVVWYSHLFKTFPQFAVIHTIKVFGIVNEGEVDAFLEFPCYFYYPTDVGSLISGSSAFSKWSLNIWKFSVHILLKLGWRILTITLLWTIFWPPNEKNWLLGKNWCWERLKAGGEGDNRGQDGWITSPIQWTWVWASSRRWWRTEKPDVLQSMGSQRVRHDWATDNWTEKIQQTSKYNNKSSDSQI